MEDAVGAGADGLITENAARADYADGRFPTFHSAHLNAGSMCSQQQGIRMAGRYEESILHIAGGVVRGEIKGSEHMIIVINFRAFSHIIAEFSEDVYNFLPHNAHRMP